MLRPSLLLTLCAFVALTGCALRPRYNDVVKTVTGMEQPSAEVIVFRLVEPKSGTPIAGATVTAGRGPARAEAKSGPDGMVTLPWTKELAKDNPLLVVSLPGNTAGYRIERVASATAPETTVNPAKEAAPAEVAAPPAAEPTPATELPAPAATTDDATSTPDASAPAAPETTNVEATTPASSPSPETPAPTPGATVTPEPAAADGGTP